jgi:uncharacterized membrane protein YwzB
MQKNKTKQKKLAMIIVINVFGGHCANFSWV